MKYLVLFSLLISGCSVFRPSGPTSPCPGMVCEDITIASSIVVSLCARTRQDLEAAKRNIQVRKE